jgi:hypothetical protein
VIRALVVLDRQGPQTAQIPASPHVKSSKPSTTASDREAIALLARYKCPTAFQEVRTLLMGNISFDKYHGVYILRFQPDA